MAYTTNVKKIRMIDIAVNITDPMFFGIYRDKVYHEGDLDLVLHRARVVGVEKLLVTGTDLKTSQECLELISKYPDYKMYSTVGVHPTRCNEFEANKKPEEHFKALRELIMNNRDKVAALGECGLDYARLGFCNKATQKKYFWLQLDLASEFKLPVFFHNRDTEGDFLRMVTENRDKFTTGVVHSYDGPLDEALALIDLGLYIGINGCSLKTQENLDVVSKLPLDKIMIETDAPWCEIRGNHACYPILLKSIIDQPEYQPPEHFQIHKKEKFSRGSMVKFRNEPCTVYYILHVLSRLHNVPIEELSEIIYNTTQKVFFQNEMLK